MLFFLGPYILTRPPSLEIFALFMLTCIFSTLILTETKGKTLEELSNESQDGFIKGVSKPVEIKDGLIVGARNSTA